MPSTMPAVERVLNGGSILLSFLSPCFLYSVSRQKLCSVYGDVLFLCVGFPGKCWQGSMTSSHGSGAVQTCEG